MRFWRWFFGLEEPSTWAQMEKAIKAGHQPKVKRRAEWAKPDARYAPMNRKPRLVEKRRA